jgi:hypothetical protein
MQAKRISFLGVPFSVILWLCLPARLSAYPADSLLLVQVRSYYAPGDTSGVVKREYSRDNQGFGTKRYSPITMIP